MQFLVQSPADLGLPLSKAIAEARAGAALEVVFPAGDFTGADLVIRDPTKPPTLAVTVRSDGGPAVLRGMRIDIRARHIVLEGVELRDYAGEKTPVRLSIGNSAALRRVTFGGLRVDGLAQQPAIVFEGVKKAGPKSVTIEDSWIVDNAVSASQLVLVDASPRDPFTTFTMRRVGILRNQADTILHAYALEHLALDHTAVVEPTAQSVFWCAWTENTVSAADSRIVMGQPGPWVRRDSNPPSNTTFPPPSLSNTSVERGVSSADALAGDAGTMPGLPPLLGGARPL